MKKYDIEFKKECVQKYLEGQSVASISRDQVLDEVENDFSSSNPHPSDKKGAK